jgi:hypothetical protein
MFALPGTRILPQLVEPGYEKIAQNFWLWLRKTFEWLPAVCGVSTHIDPDSCCSRLVCEQARAEGAAGNLEYSQSGFQSIRSPVPWTAPALTSLSVREQNVGKLRAANGNREEEGRGGEQE